MFTDIDYRAITYSQLDHCAFYSEAYTSSQVWLAPTDIMGVLCTPLMRCNYSNNLYLVANFKRQHAGALKYQDKQLQICREYVAFKAARDKEHSLNVFLTFSSSALNASAPILFSAMTTPRHSFSAIKGNVIMHFVLYPVCLSTKSENFLFCTERKQRTRHITHTAAHSRSLSL